MRQVLLAALLSFFAHGALAHEFSLKDMQGRVHHLSDYRGKWVLVNFWATWCAPCLEELPELAALYKAHKNKDLVVLGVAMDYPSAKVVHDFLRENPLPYPIVLGDKKVVRQVGKVVALPTSYVFSPNGSLMSNDPGTVTRASVEKFIRENEND